MIKLTLRPITLLLDIVIMGTAEILTLILWDIKYMDNVEPFEWTMLLWRGNKKE